MSVPTAIRLIVKRQTSSKSIILLPQDCNDGIKRI